MKTRTSPVVLGFIWGMFSMLLSFAVVSVFASLRLVFVGFPLLAYNAETQYIIIAGVFLLSVLGAIGAGIVHRLPKLGGGFILLSSVGVAFFLFGPVLMQSFSFAPLAVYNVHITPLMLLVADFVIILFTVIGLTGGILAFIPKKDRKAKPEMIPQPLPVPIESAPAQPVVQQIPAAPAPQSDIAHAAPPPTDIDLMNLE